MRNAILYAGTIVAVVQIFYLAQLAAQHGEPTIDAGRGRRRGVRAIGRSTKRTTPHHYRSNTTSRPHTRSRTTTPRAPRCSRARPSPRSRRRPKTIRRPTSRADRVEAFVRHIHAKFAPIRPQGFGVRNDPHRASDGKVWETFYEAVESSLNGPYSDLAFASPEEVRNDGSIFPVHLVIQRRSARHFGERLRDRFFTRESLCGLGAAELRPEAAATRGCKTAVMPSDMRVHDMDADVDCVQAYCARSNAKCDTIRVVRFNESETFGPSSAGTSVRNCGRARRITCK